MGVFDRDKKNSIDEKRYRQILAEEELEEEYFNREHSFKKVEDKIKEKEAEIVEEYKDDTDYDEYSNDYANFNTVKEDYDYDYDDDDDEKSTVKVEKTTTTTTSTSSEEYEDADSGYTFDKSLIVSIVSSIYKWFVRVSVVLAILLILYLLLKTKFIAAFLYIISLVCAFMFGYVVMFAVNYLFFRE